MQPITQPARATAGDEPVGSKAKILLVDDHLPNLLALEVLLQDLGLEQIEARSGEEALHRLLNDDFAAILLDVQMPGMDGFETARHIRTRQRSRHTPILFVTAHETDRQAIEKAYELGAVDFLIKPLIPAILRAKVGVFVELYEKSREIRRQANELRQRERQGFEQKMAAEHQRAELLRNVRLAVTQILAQAGAVAEAAPEILKSVCEALDWDMGALWAVDRQAGVLRCQEAWRRPGARLGEFETVTRRQTFEPGRGLPGRVWSSGRPAWVPDVVHDANFPRSLLAAAEGVHGAFGCPISLGGAILGVMEFFSREIRPPDADLLEMMSTIGGQVGQFMERRRALDALRASEARKTAIVESALDCIISIDHQGRIIEFNPAAERHVRLPPGRRAPSASGRPDHPAGVPRPPQPRPVPLPRQRRRPHPQPPYRGPRDAGRRRGVSDRAGCHRHLRRRGAPLLGLLA